MIGPSGERCGFCYYCADAGLVNADENVGFCKRYPPTYLDGTGNCDNPQTFPEVSIADWCGEFRPHPKMQEKVWREIIQRGFRHYNAGREE